MRKLTFTNMEADFAAINDVIRGLEGKGLSSNEASACVLADMAQQAMMQGMDARGAMDALFKVMNEPDAQPDEQVSKPVMKQTMTRREVDDLHKQMNAYRDMLLYWDIILCTEIQHYAYLVETELKDRGLYRHELKQYTNKLMDEARKIQVRIKDNDLMVVTEWCRCLDTREAFVSAFYKDGGNISSKLVLAFLSHFKTKWELVKMDCGELGEASGSKHKEIVSMLLVLEVLTRTGIDLYNELVKRMRLLMAKNGTMKIRKSTHHESMNCAVNNLLRKIGAANVELSPSQVRNAQKHVAELQTAMVTDGCGDFFVDVFNDLSEEFTRYMIARMRMELEEGCVSIGSIRALHYRLGTRHRIKKFFKQLREYPMPEAADDVLEVMAEMDIQQDNSEVFRFFHMCKMNDRHEEPESVDKQEARALRRMVRRNNGMLPDDVLRVMALKDKTKKALMEHLSSCGFELKPTLRRIRKMKASELKHI